MDWLRVPASAAPGVLYLMAAFRMFRGCALAQCLGFWRVLGAAWLRRKGRWSLVALG
jgi:hypothetical protein